MSRSFLSFGLSLCVERLKDLINLSRPQTYFKIRQILWSLYTSRFPAGPLIFISFCAAVYNTGLIACVLRSAEGIAFNLWNSFSFLPFTKDLMHLEYKWIQFYSRHWKSVNLIFLLFKSGNIRDFCLSFKMLLPPFFFCTVFVFFIHSI